MAKYRMREEESRDWTVSDETRGRDINNKIP